jgi:hypothetical protein
MKQQHIYQIVFLLTPTPNNTNTVVYLKAGLEILKVNFTLRSCRGWGTLIITIRCRCVPQVGFVNIKTVFHLSCYLFCSSAGEGTIITVTTFCLPLGPQILTLSTFRLCAPGCRKGDPKTKCCGRYSIKKNTQEHVFLYFITFMKGLTRTTRRILRHRCWNLESY